MAQRRRRINRKKQAQRLLFLFAIFCLIVFTFVSNFTRLRLWIKGYGFSQQNIILNLENKHEYLDVDSVIDLGKWDELENDGNYIDYENYARLKGLSKQETISYVDSFYALSDELETLGYTIDVSRELMSALSISDFEKISSNQYKYEDIRKYLEVNGCVIDDIALYQNSGMDPLDAVLNISYPLINSQNGVNRNYIIDEPANKLVLVKSGFQLDSTYVPSDLVDVNILIAPENSSTQLREEAAEALEDMAAAAKKEGYELAIKSAYRSYVDQEAVYNEYFSLYDPVTAASLVAVPGYSEHQLGLSVDLTCKSVIDGVYGVFGDSPDYKWTVEHASEYGFILRYPEDKTQITGTANEPWHYRYVGKKAAKEIYENNWTLEEYILNHGFAYTMHYE